MISERRQRRRIAFERPVRITTEDGDRYSLMSQDFSMQGLGFLSDKPRDIGEVLRVTLNIGHNGKTHIINALGEVVHRRYQNNKFRVGMRFFKDK
jgi:hypothetical protein